MPSMKYGKMYENMQKCLKICKKNFKICNNTSKYAENMQNKF